jgi:hypothetical protein
VGVRVCEGAGLGAKLGTRVGRLVNVGEKDGIGVRVGTAVGMAVCDGLEVGADVGGQDGWWVALGG